MLGTNENRKQKRIRNKKERTTMNKQAQTSSFRVSVGACMMPPSGLKKKPRQNKLKKSPKKPKQKNYEKTNKQRMHDAIKSIEKSKKKTTKASRHTHTQKKTNKKPIKTNKTQLA